MATHRRRLNLHATAAALIAARLADGHQPIGAYTPAAAFGPDIAIAAGGQFILDHL